jgi:D-alanine-D-alanine ligase
MDRMSARSLRVAVLAGGESAERDVSLASGARVAAALVAAGHEATVVDPATDGLERISQRDFGGCFLALHGGEGEDGRLQRRLARRGIPFTGSGPAASALAMSKSAAKERFRRFGIPTPDYVTLGAQESPEAMRARVVTLGFPVLVKPDAQGSSLGVGIALAPEELSARVGQASRYGRLVLAERRIVGRELTVSVLDRRALPPLEIVSRESIFDFHAKYASELTEYHFDLGLSPIKTKELQAIAVAAADALGTSGLVRVDLMMDDQEGFWVLEVNTSPGMTGHSLAPMAAEQAGIAMPELCEWILRNGWGEGKW